MPQVKPAGKPVSAAQVGAGAEALAIEGVSGLSARIVSRIRILFIVD